MTHAKLNCRADTEEVTEILSNAEAVTMPVRADDVPHPISPERVEKMGFPLAWIQEVRWETYPGLHGPQTLLKRVEYDTTTCPECDTIGRFDDHGDVICDNDECGCVLSKAPMLLPEDGFADRISGLPSKVALNPAQSVEPDVEQ